MSSWYICRVISVKIHLWMIVSKLIFVLVLRYLKWFTIVWFQNWRVRLFWRHFPISVLIMELPLNAIPLIESMLGIFPVPNCFSNVRHFLVYNVQCLKKIPICDYFLYSFNMKQQKNKLCQHCRPENTKTEKHTYDVCAYAITENMLYNPLHW